MSVADIRWEVYSRDMGCVAPVLDDEAGLCFDKWGKVLPQSGQGFEDLEMDYVRLESHGPRHTLPEDHVMLCPGHHRGTGPLRGYQWATAHRRDERDYLERRHGA